MKPPQISRLAWGLLIVLIALGAAIRFVDLTEPPVDFHPTRQLRDAIIARALYYRWLPHPDPEKARLAQETAAPGQVEKFEPPLLEGLVAATYLAVGGEHVWIARIYSILFWLLGVLGVFLLAHALAGEAGALAAAAFPLFLPLAVQASRSFQPDPLMSALIVWTAYAAYRWAQHPAWKPALWLGVVGGLAILVKAFAIYEVAGITAGALVIVGRREGWKAVWGRAQTWVMGVLMLAPVGLYLLLRGEHAAGGYIAYWMLAFHKLWFARYFYTRWAFHFLDWFTPLAVLLAFAGLYFARQEGRPLLLGWMVGYGLLGFSVPYLIISHNYYSLPATFWVAVALAPTVETVWGWARAVGRRAWMSVAALGLLFIAVGVRADLHLLKASYWGEAERWAAVAAAVPTDGKVIGLTPTYGMRIRYFGWRPIGYWPPPGEYAVARLQDRPASVWHDFQWRTKGYRYFLVAAEGFLDAEPQLKYILTHYYPCIAKGPGYQVYDLAHPLKPLPKFPPPEEQHGGS